MTRQMTNDKTEREGKEADSNRKEEKKQAREENPHLEADS
jgi:hypothetical protein